MTSILFPIHGENDFRRSVEVIGLLQDEEVWAKLGNPKCVAITFDMHFHLC